ncbi:MAG TPA: PqqD family protein [Candidatus Krumholzibacterium sp.]|nr:PqqD family protein [Candidatus Krumholzibacterium sp.]
MKKKYDKHEVNLIKLVPERIIGFEIHDDSSVTILKPRFTGKLAKRFIEPRARVKTFKVDLDEIGSAVWALCDGKRNVGEIGREMKEKFGDAIEPCFDRLAIFFAHLEASEFIRYSNLDSLKEGK